MTFTDEQKSFIEDRGHNILVSAAAGSGKTAVITERVLSLISDDGYSISELLVVTFTRAAASEMRDRIRDAISEKLLSPDLTDGKKEHLLKQMTLIYTADITTIDSFCLNLVREHFNICDTDPSFRVADESELKLIAEDVMDELLEERYQSEDEAFFRFVDDTATSKSDEDVAEAIRSVYRFAVARPDPAGYISSMMKEYEAHDSEELGNTAFMKELMRIVRDRLELADSILNNARSICASNGGPYMYADMIDSDLEQLEMIAGNDTYESLRSALEDISFKQLSRKSDDAVDPDLKEKVKGLRDCAKKILKDEIAGKYLAKHTDDILYELSGCLPAATMLADLTLEYMDRYAAAKKEAGVVEFSDLEHMALKILGDDDTRETMQRRYKELIIDEYQDTNRVQEAIFAAISNGHDYVTVGDVKQSIYSFRDACPALFMNKYARYESGEEESSRLITLSRNFRSSQHVINAVNDVFSNIMSLRCGGAVYDDSQSLHYGDIYKHEDERLSCEYLNIIPDESGSTDALTCEAEAIAARIKELTGDEGPDIEDRKDHSVHHCSYGDIVILLRSAKVTADTFSEVFAREGIPLVFDSQSGYLFSYEILEIMNLLKIIDNPRQDIPLAGVMLGYFGGFSASEMALIRGSFPEGDLYDSLKGMADDTPGSGGKASAESEGLSGKCSDFLDMLKRYRSMSVYTPIHELVDIIIHDHSYDHYLRSLSDGVRREGNLRLLKKRAADYEETSFHGLFKFLRYIENMKKYEIDLGEASSGKVTDAVRIMSIHHSKGLEFPVVFVSSLARDINQSDSTARILFDDELGAGMDLVIRDRNLKIRTLIKQVIAAKKKESTVSEEMRVLYVAMTRAQNKLILTSRYNEKANLKTDPVESVSLADMIDISENLANNSVRYQRQQIPYEPSENESTDDSAAIPGIPSKKVIELKAGISDEEAGSLLKDIRFVYPYERSVNVPQKVSVSFIKHEAMEEKGVSIASDPRGDRVVPTVGAARGTAVHTAYENLPLDLTPCAEEAEAFLDRLVATKKLTETERGYIKASDIIDFLNTGICSRMREADSKKQLYREQPFIISVPASSIDSSYPEEDRVMVQGIIDAFFIEDGRIVVVDYKTDSVSDEKVLTDRYRKQLDYYESALCQLLGIDDSQKIIYSVSLKKEILL
ncbi:MAG: helicase-exonuclease AddAB subunit AddA [Lachnospiraceae bacterium]|nr:helicase-exonuclease AddAB subunit AddA [Lachnospiraceae bacterium]